MLSQIIHLINHLQDNLLFNVLLGCVAIWKPKGVQIAKKYLQNSFDNNKDGAGFAYVQKGKVIIQKGYFTFNEFWKAYQPFQKLAALIHFRIATHGKVDETNCHPFSMVDGKYALVHNGVMPSSLHSGNKDESDTKQFADKLETCIELVPFEHEGFQAFLEEAIGYNKVAILRNDGKVWLLNEKKGEWHKGAWYSNHTYAYAPKVSTFTAIKDAATGLWSRLGYGSREQPVWSEFHKCFGFYEPSGKFTQVNIETDDEETSNIIEAEFDNMELTEEEVNELAQLHLEEIDGDFEFMPETEQERYVQKWLAIKKKESLAAPKGVVNTDSDANAVNLDYEPSANHQPSADVEAVNEFLREHPAIMC